MYMCINSFKRIFNNLCFSFCLRIDNGIDCYHYFTHDSCYSISIILLMEKTHIKTEKSIGKKF